MLTNIQKIHWDLSGRILSRQEVEAMCQQNQYQESVEQLLVQAERLQAVQVIEGSLTCRRCNNQNLTEFALIPQKGENKAIYYCLKCLQMGRMSEDKVLYFFPAMEKVIERQKSLLTWEGVLSSEQERASLALIKSLSQPTQAYLIHAVTGAGKTEMIFPVINEILRNGGRVAVVSPRIDVCLELFPRLQAAFKSVSVIVLYGAMEEAYQYTPLVIATTHQLLRFQEAFDLIIVDEVDAFPYAGDASLHFAVTKALKKKSKLIYLTATPDKAIEGQIAKQMLEVTTLPARYHGYALPEPVFKWIGDWQQAIEKKSIRSKLWQLLQSFLEIKGVKLIFMPHIVLAEKLFVWMLSENPDLKIACVHAKDPLRKEKISDLRQGKYDGLITTTILERGVTFTNCHVCIVGSESSLYSKAALVQMSGRVGRRPDYPTGRLIYAHHGKSRAMIKARNEIKQMNRLAKERKLIAYES